MTEWLFIIKAVVLEVLHFVKDKNIQNAENKALSLRERIEKRRDELKQQVKDNSKTNPNDVFNSKDWNNKKDNKE